MTYEEAVNKLDILMSETSFNVAVILFDKAYGECAKEKGIYDDALSLYLMHKDALGDGTETGGSQSVEYVSISKGESTGTSNYLKDMFALLETMGCSKRKTFIGAYASKVRGAC